MYWGHLVWICSGLVSYLTLFLTLVNFYCASWWPINCGYSASFWTVVHQKWALKEALSLQKYKDAHTHIHWGWWTNRRQRRNKQKQKKLASLLKSRDEIRYWREELNNWKDQSQHLMVPGYQFRWDGPWYEKKTLPVSVRVGVGGQDSNKTCVNRTMKLLGPCLQLKKLRKTLRGWTIQSFKTWWCKSD